MASVIENFLYGNFGTHGLIKISFSIGQITVAVAPWADLERVTEVVFERVKLLSIYVGHVDGAEDLELPLDIIGFDSKEQADGQWEFVLYFGIEVVFLADFPTTKTLI